MGAGVALGFASLALLAFCVTAETAQQICFKAGSNRIPDHRSAIRGALMEPLVWAGVAIWIVEVLAWILALQRTPISIAYPVMALVYVGVPACGALLLHERLTARQIGGACLIAGGVLCVVFSGGR